MENSVTHIPGTHRNLRAKMLLIALISLFFQQWSYAQIPDSLFIAANKDYQKADYNGPVEREYSARGIYRRSCTTIWAMPITGLAT